MRRICRINAGGSVLRATQTDKLLLANVTISVKLYGPRQSKKKKETL